MRVGAAACVEYSGLGTSTVIGPEVTIQARAGAELGVDIKGVEVHPIIEKLGCVAGDGAVITRSVPAGTLIPAGQVERSPS